MEWSFRVMVEEIYLHFHRRFKKGHTLAQLSVLKEKKKEEMGKTVSSAVAVAGT